MHNYKRLYRGQNTPIRIALRYWCSLELKEVSWMSHLDLKRAFFEVIRRHEFASSLRETALSEDLAHEPGISLRPLSGRVRAWVGRLQPKARGSSFFLKLGKNN